MNFENEKYQENLQSILGKPEDYVLHAMVPFDLGYNAGGAADVYVFKNHLDGVVYVTGDLTGEKQGTSDAGNYELMICHREEEKWGVNLIKTLAYYTLTASIKSGDTMDLGPFTLEENTIKAFIFYKYASFTIDLNKYSLMLIIGITVDELEYTKVNGSEKLINILKEKNIFPFTDLKRDSIFK